MENTKFNVGDAVVLLPNWNGLLPDEYKGTVLIISKINNVFSYLGRITTRIDFDKRENCIWAEPHEIRHVTPLEKALK